MVTLRLWLTDAVVGLGVLGRIFRQEIWPARRLSPGVGVYYWRWSNPYVGPNWMRLLVCGVYYSPKTGQFSGACQVML